MWEMFFEVWAPAPNDWLNTSFGGINLGEVTYRLSGLVLKNEATGTNRALRETGAFLIDPFRGFNRLVRGEMTGQSQTPPDWRPSLIQSSIDVGYRQASQSGQLSGPTTLNQGIIDFTLWYGSLLRDIRSAPFSHFRLYAELAGNDSVGKLAALETRGTLGGKTLRETDNNIQVLGAMMNYDYISNSIVEYGGQSFSGGWISGWNAGRYRVGARLLARATVIGATKSDYYDVQEGRNYDYGAGLGGTAEVAASLPGKVFARARYQTLWAPTINGASGSHIQRSAMAELRGIFLHRVGVGARFQWYESQGIYDNHPDVTRFAHAFSIFASWMVPRWRRRRMNTDPRVRHGHSHACLRAPLPSSWRWPPASGSPPARATRSPPSRPSNNPSLYLQPDTLHYFAENLENIHQTLKWYWVNNGTGAQIVHNSLVPHGSHLPQADGPERPGGLRFEHSADLRRDPGDQRRRRGRAPGRSNWS